MIGFVRSSTTLPKIHSSTLLVISIETAAEAQLKPTMIGRRLKRSDEMNASIAPTTTAAALRKEAGPEIQMCQKLKFAS